jgi:hypothetical protein
MVAALAVYREMGTFAAGSINLDYSDEIHF